MDVKNSFLSGDSSEYSLLLSEKQSMNSFEKNQINQWKKKILKNQDFPKNFMSIDVDELIQKTGGLGNYQYFLLIFCIFANFINGMMFEPLPYIYYQPNYECLVNGVYVSCNKAQACATQYKFHYERHSVIEDYSLECGNVIEICLTMVFILNGILDSIFEYLADIFGRKKIYIVNLIMQLMAFIINIQIKNFWLNAVCNALIMVGVTINYSLLIVLVSESMPNKFRNKCANLMFISEILGYLMFTFIEMFQVDYIHVYYLGLIPTIFIFLFSLRLKETLYFQQESLMVKEMFSNAIEIHKENKHDQLAEIKKMFLINLDHKIFLKGINTFRLRRRSKSSSETIKMDKMFWNILLSCLVLSIVTEGFDHFLLLYLQRIGGNIYVNGIVCGIIQIFAYIASFMMEHVRRKTIFKSSIYAIFASSLFFIVCKLNHWDKSQNFQYYSILVIGIEFFFTSLGQAIVFTYPVEAFNTSQRMIGLSIIGLLMYFFIPTLIWTSTFFEYYGLNPVLSVLPLSIFAYFQMYFIPETLGKKLE